MKSLTLIFYGTNGDAAKVLAGDMRKQGQSAQLRHAYAFTGEVEDADRVLLMPCVTDYDVVRISEVFGDKVALHGAAVPPPPPPPPGPPDVLAGLPDNWRKMEPAQLKAIAAAHSGRAVENKDQAIQVIADALAERAAPQT